MSILTKILIIYYITVNIVLFAMMGIDKKYAIKHRYRIPEANLFVASLLGGCVGGLLGMRVFHHKTKKTSFYVIYGISLILHCALVYFIAVNFIMK